MARAVPEVAMDYAFFRNKTGGEYIVVLILKDRGTGLIFAHVVPAKGAMTEWVPAQIRRDLARLGHHGQLILRCDQEEAITALA